MILNSKIRFICIFFSILLAFPAVNSYAATSVCFGYFNNNSGNSTLDYLEIILPSSMASTLKKKYDIKTLKVKSLSKKLKDNNLLLKKRYDDIELPRLSEYLGADYFIFGEFESAGYNRIKIKVSIYEANTFKVFTFTDFGYLETEIFTLIDRLALQLNGILSDNRLYIAEKIRTNSRVGIITNLEGEDLNKLYFEFMKNKFLIKNFQANNLENIVSDCTIDKFFHISTEYASYRIIARKEDVQLFYTTWSSKKSMEKILNLKRIYHKYAYNFIKSQNEVLDNINKHPFSRVDYLIIIGFNDDHDTAWARCLNMANKRLVYTQSGISYSSIDEITRQIIGKLTGKI